MPQLQRECLAIAPMRESEVEAVYKYPTNLSVKEVIRLCLSHERLRAELAGVEALYEELKRDNPKENKTGNRND